MAGNRTREEHVHHEILVCRSDSCPRSCEFLASGFVDSWSDYCSERAIHDNYHYDRNRKKRITFNVVMLYCIGGWCVHRHQPI